MSLILICGGGTAGHVVPALAVADVLTSKGHKVHFCGGAGMEGTLVPRAGYPFSRVRVLGFKRSLGLDTLRTLAYLPLAGIDAARLLFSLRPDCVVGVGGYASGPVVAEAALVGMPSVAVEMDSHLGWTNRILSTLVDRVCLSFPLPDRDNSKFVYTGRPIRPGLLEASREEGQRRFELDPELATVIIFGGSLGARTLNDAAVAAFARKATPFQIIHVAGNQDHPRVSEILKEEGVNPRYQVFSYLDDFPLALAAADVAVARAGGSVAELLARGVPSILVPFPEATADHQTKNAQMIVDAGAGVLIPDRDMNENRLETELEKLLVPEVRDRMSRAALALARPDAAIRIAEEIVELTGPQGAKEA